MLLTVAGSIRAAELPCDTLSAAWEVSAAGLPAWNYVLMCDGRSRVYQLFPEGRSGKGSTWGKGVPVLVIKGRRGKGIECNLQTEECVDWRPAPF